MIKGAPWLLVYQKKKKKKKTQDGTWAAGG